MDSFEFNKIAMSVLGVAFVVMSLNFLSDGIFHADVPEEAGYAVEVASLDSSGDAEEDTGPAFDPVAPILASASVESGEKEVKKCAACHTFEQGGQNKVGPALYGIVNRDIASVDGFGYSGALVEYGAGKQWTYEELNGFLWKPKTFVKGTSMGFAGVKKVEDRADIIAYLRSLAATPAPLPDPNATTASDTSEGAATEESTDASADPAASESTDTSEGAETEGDASGTSEESTSGEDNTSTENAQ